MVLRIAGIHLSLAQKGPVGFACKAFFVAHPSASGSAVAEHHCLWLQTVEHFEYARIVVIVLSVNGSCVLGAAVVAVAAVCTVKPHFKHLAIVGEQVAKLCVEVGEIAGGGIVGTAAVPWRQIYGKLQSVLLAGFRQFAHDIAFASTERRFAHIVVVTGKRPEAEAVVMLGSKDDTLHSCCDKRACPLFAIEFSGVECHRVGVAVSPFAVVECV